MPMVKYLFVCLWLALLTSSGHAAAKTQLKLLLANDSARPGDTVMAGIHLVLPPGWYTYWQNPGDVGLSAKVEWKLPAGVSAGDLRWPLPHKHEAGGFIDYT